MKMMKITVRAIVHSETAGLLAHKFTEYLNKRCSVVLHSIPPATLTKAGSTRQHPYLRNVKYSKRNHILKTGRGGKVFVYNKFTF